MSFSEKKRRFAVSTGILTLTSLFLRIFSMRFGVFLADRVGEGGMGLYSLVMSVQAFAAALAVSGIGFASSRLTAEAVGRGSDRDILVSLKHCVSYSLFFGLFSCLLFFFLSGPIGKVLLGDENTVPSLRVLALSLPFLSLTTVFSGYFHAVCRVGRAAVSMILEEGVSVGVTFLLLLLFPGGSRGENCFYVALGKLISEIFSFFFAGGMLLLDLKKHNHGGGEKTPGLFQKMKSIALPLAFGSHVRMGLVTLEHTLVPKMLRRNGLTQEEALAGYGLVHGMVLPVVLFPSVLLGAFAGLLIPSLAELNSRKEKNEIDATASRSLSLSLAFSIGTAGILSCFAYEIAVSVYHSPDSFPYIRALAALIPVMYTDTVVDSLLKGLDRQLDSMAINIADALLSVLLVCLLPPFLGVKGYLAAIFLSELFNFALSFSRLLSVCSPRLSPKKVLCPLAGIFFSTSVVTLSADRFSFTGFGETLSLIARIGLTLLLYLFWLLLPLGKTRIEQRKRVSGIRAAPKKKNTAKLP